MIVVLFEASAVTTGAVGYIETLTDPAFKGQIVVQAFPLIGNYGMISADAESFATNKLQLSEENHAALQEQAELFLSQIL